MDFVKKIVVQGVKGGVGNTTIVANMAVSLVNLGYRVICIDACQSNDLCLHFGGNPNQSNGIFKALMEEEDWSKTSYQDDSQVIFYPFGKISTNTKPLSELSCLDFLLTAINFEETPTVILVDFPSYLDLTQQPTFSQFDAKVISATSDIASFNKISQRFQQGHDEYLLLNRFSPYKELESELQTLVSAGLNRAHYLGAIYNDEYIHEALAQNSCAVHLNQYRKCAKDFNQVALKVVANLFDTDVMHQVLINRAELSESW